MSCLVLKAGKKLPLPSAVSLLTVMVFLLLLFNIMLPWV